MSEWQWKVEPSYEGLVRVIEILPCGVLVEDAEGDRFRGQRAGLGLGRDRLETVALVHPMARRDLRLVHANAPLVDPALQGRAGVPQVAVGEDAIEPLAGLRRVDGQLDGRRRVAHHILDSMCALERTRMSMMARS